MPRRAARLPTAVAIVLGLVLALLPVRAAQACSCAEPQLDRVLAGAADQALVVARRLDNDGGPAGELEVLETLAGGPVLGPVDARFDTGASCDPWMNAGGVAALLLARDDDRWTTTTCGILDVGAAHAVAGEVPRPDPSAGVATLLLAGDHGGARLAAVDAAGRVAAWGTGRGAALGVDLCDDGETVVEVAADQGTLALHRWRLPDLDPIGPAVELGEQRAHDAGVRCEEAGGERAVVVLPSYGEPGSIAVVEGADVVRRSVPVQGVATGGGTLAALVGTGDVGGSPASQLAMVDDLGVLVPLLSRADTAFDRLAVSPDGTHVLAVGYPVGAGAGEVMVVAAVDGSGTWSRQVSGYHAVGWMDADTLWVRDEEGPAFGAVDTGVELRDRTLTVVGDREVGPAGSLTGLPGDAVLRHGRVVPSVLRDGQVAEVAQARLAGTTTTVVLDPGAVLTSAPARAAEPPPGAMVADGTPVTDDGGRIVWVTLAVVVAVLVGSAVALVVARRASRRDH